jgi:hypothetical protein
MNNAQNEVRTAYHELEPLKFRHILLSSPFQGDTILERLAHVSFFR